MKSTTKIAIGLATCFLMNWVLLALGLDSLLAALGIGFLVGSVIN